MKIALICIGAWIICLTAALDALNTRMKKLSEREANMQGLITQLQAIDNRLIDCMELSTQTTRMNRTEIVKLNQALRQISFELDLFHSSSINYTVTNGSWAFFTNTPTNYIISNLYINK